MTTYSHRSGRLSFMAAVLMCLGAGLAGEAAAGGGQAADRSAPATQPDHASATQAAVRARRGKTALSRLAEQMKPGAWAELKTEGLTGALRTAPPPGRGLDIMGWTDDAHWDSLTGQFFYMGLRQTRRFIAFSEQTNAWRDIPLPANHEAEGSPHLANQYGHIYGNNAFDPETSRFYHLYHGGRGAGVVAEQPGGVSCFDAVREKWTKLPPGGGYSMTGNIEYFTARKGLVVLGGQGQVRFFSEQRQAWEPVGKVDVCGHHSLARHNPFRQEVLLAGGNQSPQTVVRMDNQGRLQRLKDSPVGLTIRHDKLTVDPVSGRYLILKSEEKKLFEFDSRKNEYRLADDFTTAPWPFHRYDMPVVAFIPEHGVTMWVASRVWLYKHDAQAAGDAPTTAPDRAPLPLGSHKTIDDD